MIKVTNFATLSDLSRDYLILKWKIADTTENMKNYCFNVYRSIELNNREQADLISTISGDAFECYDTTATQYRRDVNFYYYIDVVDIRTNNVIDTANCIALYDRNKDVYANYIRHVNKVYLNVVNNNNAYILTRRNFGQKCSRCWDDIRRQHKQHNCPSCFGTGYEGGYSNPYNVKFNYINSPSSVYENTSMDGRSNNSQDINIWIESYPIVSVGDIFIDNKNNRYKITQVQRTTKNNEYILRQVLNVQLLSTSDPVYSVIIDVGGDTVE